MRSTSEILLETLRLRVAQWTPPLPWGVGYSGGRDSGVLLWALVQVAGPRAVVALHVDHGWRPEAERRAESALVARVCQRLGVDLLPFGPPGSGSGAPVSEAGARAHRYAAFQRFIDEHPGSPVWLAHHADDQAETILMRVLQGRSWQGLAGIPARRGPFLRPLLGLRAGVLARVADEVGLEFHRDSTNNQTVPLRNFLRLEVFPLLEQRFPRAVDALGDLGRSWAQLSPGGTLHPGWVLGPGGGRVAVATWQAWGPLERQAQLLAVAQRVSRGRLARRFLETVARSTAPVEGAGWSWKVEGDQVLWQTVVRPVAKEYFIEVEPDRWYTVGEARLRWTLGTGQWEVPGLVPSRPWVCRTPSPGMRYSSDDDSDWGKDVRRRRLGSLEVPKLLVLQDRRLRAVLDLETGTPVWREKAGEKLNNNGIFVTLEKRSDYERR